MISLKYIFNAFTIMPSVRVLKNLDCALKNTLPIILLSEVHIGGLTSMYV